MSEQTNNTQKIVYVNARYIYDKIQNTLPEILHVQTSGNVTKEGEKRGTDSVEITCNHTLSTKQFVYNAFKQLQIIGADRWRKRDGKFPRIPIDHTLNKRQMDKEERMLQATETNIEKIDNIETLEMLERKLKQRKAQLNK